MFPVEIKDTDGRRCAKSTCTLPAKPHSVISKISYCKFPLESNGEDYVQCDIKNSTLAVVSFDVQLLPGCHGFITGIGNGIT